MSNTNILIIDDNVENIKYAGNLLKKNGFKVLTALSGKKGVKIAKNKDIDLILLDIMMPEIDGFQTARLFKSDSQLIDIPIIFLTAKDINEFIDKAFKAGGVDYVMKPINSNELLARISIHLTLKQKEDELKKAYSIIRKKNQKLKKLLITDELTQLYTRNYILERIKNEKERYERYKHRFSLIMCDIDFFKSVNDNYGHNGGDYILKETAKLLKNETRKQDIVSRWGGEEFLILLPETNYNLSIKIAKRILKKIRSKVFLYKDKNIYITMSLGVSKYRNQSIAEFIKEADDKLYLAKNNGRDQVQS